MTETPDSLFLKMAVAKGLIDAPSANSFYREAISSKRELRELLIERQILTSHQILMLSKEAGKANGPKIIAGFQIIDKLGQGGMGAVYRATQLSIGRQVALKIMAPQVAKNAIFAERFLREARAMGAINHPHVITCFDVGNDGKVLYMALELMTGGDADQLARSFGGILPVARACAIVRDCAAGLVAIHGAGLLHRDIKPANIFLGESGAAKLADLGLARHDDGQDQMTHTGTAMGTPAYMSPEQALGVDDLDIRSDIYALGATLFALTTGQAPFVGQSAYAIVAKVINETAPDPRSLNPNLPAGVVQIIRAAMHKDRNKRPQTPHELQLMLARCYDELIAAGLTETTVGPVPARLIRTLGSTPSSNGHRQPVSAETIVLVRKRKLAVTVGIATVGIAAAALLAVGVAVWSSSAPKPPPSPAPSPVVIPPIVVAQAPALVNPPVKKSAAAKPLVINDPWPEQSAWILATSALPADQQLARVLTALTQLNPAFNGENQSTIDPSAGQVTSLILSAKGLDDLRPLQALKHLDTLILRGADHHDRGPLFQLASLQGLPLRHLAIPWTMVEDLSPLRGMPLIDVDLAGSTVTDLTPILTPHLQRLAFSTEKIRRGMTTLRELPTLTALGTSWESLTPVATFWQTYDAGELPGSEARILPKETPPEPDAAPDAAPEAVAPQAPAPVEAALPPPPRPIAVTALTIPETANPKVRAFAKSFNEAVVKLVNGLTQKRKDATKVPLKVLSDDYSKSSQKALKDPAQLGVAMAAGKAKFALENETNPRATVFTDPLLPNTTQQALNEWRASIEPLEAEAAASAQERREKILKDLEPFVSDGKSGASELITQLQAMMPTAPPPVIESEPLPFDGVIWRFEGMASAPHETLVRDLSGNQTPARLIGDIVETTYGKAFSGDGRGTQISVPLKRPLSARTLIAWVNITHVSLTGGVLGLQSPDGTRFETMMYLGSDQGWGIASANPRRSLITNERGYGEGRWRHLAMVVNGTKRTFYENAEAIASDQLGEASFPAGSELIIGKRNSGRDERHFAGLIDGVLVFDRALTAAEILKVRNTQIAIGERIRTEIREREWVTVPVNNGDFSKIGNSGRIAEWQSRGDGVSVIADADGRFLRLDQSKAGQEPRIAKQAFKIEPTWRALRMQVRLRMSRSLGPVPEKYPFAGVSLVLDDPNGGQPSLRRMVNLSENAQLGVWEEPADGLGWPVPPGYSLCTIECSMRNYLGQFDIDDVKVAALVGKP